MSAVHGNFKEENVEFDDSLSTSMGDFGEQTQDLEIPESLPMMAVRDVVVFNYMIIPLFVGRPGSIEAVNEGTEQQQTADAGDSERSHQRRSRGKGSL